MLGNLSKNLVKAPDYFNNIQTTKTKPYKLIKINRQQLMDTYSHFTKTANTTTNNNNTNNINKNNSNNTKRSFRYFREKDYLRKNLFLDLNYNNNLRKEVTPKVKTNPAITFEELIYGNNNNLNNSTIRTKTINEIFSPISTNRNKLKNYLNHTLITKDSIDDFNDTINSRVGNLIHKINNMNSLDYYYDKHSKKYIKENTDAKSLKNKINGGQYFMTPIKFKFPKCINNFKSQDSIFRDTMDSKLSSLSCLSPKVKEDLKTKNRNYVSKNEYCRYQNLWGSHDKNPFLESVKYMEQDKK